MKRIPKKLSLSRETVSNLSDESLRGAAGGFLSITYCGDRCGQKHTVDPDLCKTVNYSCPDQSCGCPIIIVGG